MEGFKVVIVGGGSSHTPGIIQSLIANLDRFPLKKLVLYDIDPDRLELVDTLCGSLIAKLDPECVYFTTTDPEKAYTDIDFAFAQIRQGGMEMREKDEKISLEFGVVGQETCGPGGLAYGLRTIYPMVELIDYCEKYAKPTYWIVNYSNPAAIVAKATFRLRPKARILNICDMPVAIERNMAEILECDRHDLEVDYFGLNHFGWFTKVRLNGEDVTEKLKSYVAEHGYMPQNAKSDVLHSDPSWLHTYANAKNICSAFHDYLPNTYMQYYLLGDEIVKSSDPNHTRANEVMEGREKRIFDAVADYRAGKDVDLTKFFGGVHGEFIVDVAMSLAFDLRKRYLVMVENNGAVENLPSDAMVEVPAYITDRGPEPVRVGEIPTFYKGLIEQQEAVEKLIVDAAVEHSYEKALMAFTLSKTVPSLLVAKKILDDMIVANKAYWPELH